MKKKIAFFVSVTVLFYWKVFFKAQVPFPGDLLVGAYLPWMERIPIKNALISDIFSQFYTWKSLIAQSFLSGNWPLWNPYSYAGYPLLANFNSGALNPFNLLLVFLGDMNGWSALVISQTLLCLGSFYLYMRSMKASSQASIIASIIFAFSGFCITWLMFVNVGFALAWLALMFYLIEKYIQTKQYKYFYFLSLLIFLLIVAGHFQAVVYGLVFWGVYVLYRIKPLFKFRVVFHLGLSIGLGLLLSAVQMLPTLELMDLSIRFEEGYIANYNFGLLPKVNVITFLIPDFFGNPTTGNYWGPFNYHETIIYIGIFAILSIVGSIYQYKSLSKYKFFLFSFLLTCLLIFDTPISKFLFENDLPLVSTSAAGRISMILVFSGSALSGWWFDRLKQLSFWQVLRIYWWYLLSFIVIAITTFLIYLTFKEQGEFLLDWTLRTKTIIRNLVYPFIISSLFIFAILIFRQTRIFFYLVLIIVCLDLFRFGWKYTSFVEKNYVFPTSESIEYIKNQPGVFRIERERAEIMPPNTWSQYRFMALSGYDPMAYINYVDFYNLEINKAERSFVSRYSELDHYDASTLGELNVKYFLAIRRDKDGILEPTGTNLQYKIEKDDWKIAHASKGVYVLENTKVKPRVFVSNPNSVIEITSYKPEEVIIKYNLVESDTLVLTDTNYPGWKAFVNGKQVEIKPYRDIFRLVDLPSGEGEVRFVYQPDSFYWGLKISLVSLLVWLVVYLKIKPHSLI